MMREIRVGRFTALLAEGDLRRICLDGVEVLRRVSYPVRDGGWGTHAVVTVSEQVEETAAGFTYERRFAERAGLFSGLFRAGLRFEGGDAVLDMSVALDAPKALAVNRAGFTLLHPLRGVAGAALEVTHSDGGVERLRWPDAISPGQPVFDIAGLAHEVQGVRVEIAMTGEVFEMEDQRNWTDASYKTYCRPLGWPLPYALGPDAPVRQGVRLRLSGRGVAAAAGAAVQAGVVPEVAVAVEPALAPMVLEGLPVQLRLRAGDAAPAVAGPVHLECVLEEGAEAEGLAQIANTCSGMDVVRVVALTEPYMKSHQPEGPWPVGITPMGLVPLVRAAFPKAAVGGGMFTNFTEFNRCRPDPAAVDFATFSGTAIVHAADDMSVIETLEALPAVFATGAALAGGKALHLGLCAVGMRSNPYAADCVPNPAGERLAMVRDDPRQDGRFAACFAVGVLAAAAGGVASLALGMTDGPLGVVDGGGVRPVYQVLRFAQGLRGAAAVVETGDVVRIRTGKGGIVSVWAGEVVLPAGARGWLMTAQTEKAARAAGWLDGPAGDLGGAVLGPMDIAFLEGGA